MLPVLARMRKKTEFSHIAGENVGEMVWLTLTKVNTHFTQDPPAVVLGFYPREMNPNAPQMETVSAESIGSIHWVKYYSAE